MWWKPVTWFSPAGVVVHREPEFRAEDRHLLLAHLENVAGRGPHGIQMSEATDPGNQFAFDGKGPLMDWAEKARLDKQDAYFKANPDASRNGLIFTVRKTE